MSAYAHDTQFFSRRAIVLASIIAFHVVVIYVMNSGLANKVVAVLAPPIQTDIIEEVQKQDEPPPPPPPQFERPQVEIPPPEVNISIPMESTTAITDVTSKAVPKAAPPAPRSVIHVTGKFPDTADYYPPASIRLEEQGSAVVKLCVGPNGKLAEPPRIEQSTNSTRLDEAALRLARAGRFTPGKVDGVPTTDCFKTRVKFELK